MGGGICAYIAAKYPEKVKSLVLLNNSGLSLGTKRQVVFNRMNDLIKQTLYSRNKRDNLYILFSFMRNFLFNFRILKTTFNIPVQTNIASSFSKIKCPSLILWGKNDHLIPYEHALKYKSLITNSQLNIIENAYHEWPLFKKDTLLMGSAFNFSAVHENKDTASRAVQLAIAAGSILHGRDFLGRAS